MVKLWNVPACTPIRSLRGLCFVLDLECNIFTIGLQVTAIALGAWHGIPRQPYHKPQVESTLSAAEAKVM
jgi:hypothetical protein